MTDPAALSIKDVRERWLTRQQDKTKRTQRSYTSRTEFFEEWCAEQEIETVGDLTPFDIDEFDLHMRRICESPATLRGRLMTIRLLIKYIDSLGVHDETLAELIDVPTLDRQEAASDKRLDPEEAERLLAHYRDDMATFGTPEHAFLELAWFTGARLGALRGLDLDDYEPEEGRVRFRHQPSTGTPLKNKNDGERYVGISSDVVDALEAYIGRERYDKRDEHGRRPLFCARQGRPSFTTLRAWCYRSTQPCVYGPCPHDRDPATCSYRERNHASKCPSSRAPHHIRRGSITWQLNRGLPIEVVSARVNATVRVIEEHYDSAGSLEEFEERRAAAADVLEEPTDEHDEETEDDE